MQTLPVAHGLVPLSWSRDRLALPWWSKRGSDFESGYNAQEALLIGVWGVRLGWGLEEGCPNVGRVAGVDDAIVILHCGATSDCV